MHRPKYAIGFLLAPIVCALLTFTFACSGGGAEKSVIDRFFQASKMRDNVTLGNISLAEFNKNTEGVVENYNVVSISEPKTTTLRLKELAKEYEEARKASEDLNTRKKAYQDDHPSELKAVLDAERKGSKLKGKEADFQVNWNKWREDTAAVEKRASDARQKLSAERAVADASTFNPQTPVDPTQYDGEVTSKDYTISANMITPDNQHVTKTMIITLQQVKLKSDKGDINGKWVITRVAPAEGGKAS